MSVNPLLFAEYKCYGPGSDISARSTAATSASRQLTDAEAVNYTRANIFSTATNASFGYNWMPDTTIYKFKQTTGLNSQLSKTYGDSPIVVNATSKLPVALSSSDSTVATIKGDTVVFKGAGTATVKAIQLGNYLYSAAPDSVSLVTVAKASLTATADDTTKKHGEANPNFTITYSGFVNGDTKDSITGPIASCTADASSGVGTYPITLSGGSSNNYTITLVNGTLTITPGTPVNTLDASKLLIYPNPASNIIYVKRAVVTPETLVILDINGSKLIERKLVSDMEPIDVSSLPKGTYILKLQNATYKLSIQ